MATVPGPTLHSHFERANNGRFVGRLHQQDLYHCLQLDNAATGSWVPSDLPTIVIATNELRTEALG